MTTLDTALAAGIGAGVLLGMQLVKAGYGFVRNGKDKVNGYDGQRCSKHGERLAIVETEISVRLKAIDSRLKTIEGKLS